MNQSIQIPLADWTLLTLLALLSPAILSRWLIIKWNLNKACTCTNNFCYYMLLKSMPVLIMINLITSHSHSNHKWYGKQYLQICIMSIALFPIYVSLLHLISSWSPWHATFTMLNRASSPSIDASKNKVNDSGQWEKELRYSVVWSFAAYEALSINNLEPECKTWLSELHPCWSIFHQYKLCFTNRFRLH